MKLSTDHILTTHVGSLPRPQPLVELLIKKDRDQPYRSHAVRGTGKAGGGRYRRAAGSDWHRRRQRW